MKKFFGIALALGALGMAGGAQAGTAPGTIAVSATVASSCAVNSAGAMAFGTVTGNVSAVPATSTISVTCTNTTPYTYYTNTGLYVSSSQMRMQGATTTTQYLPYTLYTTSAYTTTFPTSSTGALSGTGTGSAQTITIYGQIAAGITLPSPQTYADTVTLTVAY